MTVRSANVDETSTVDEHNSTPQVHRSAHTELMSRARALRMFLAPLEMQMKMKS